jgi:hypothetical protein
MSEGFTVYIFILQVLLYDNDNLLFCNINSNIWKKILYVVVSDLTEGYI